MNINVKKIFLMLAVLGFAGQSFAPSSRTKVRRQGSSRKLAAPAAPVVPVKKEESASLWRSGIKKDPRRTDFGAPIQLRR
ncbi:hypothetical protein FJ366_02680 [Candidatus Dependentiae bacterium]|nr:hypothetical protein [Candidatus Dependentiae bacterium]